MIKPRILGLACACLMVLAALSPVLAGPNIQAVHDRIGEIRAGKAEGEYLQAVEELEQVVTTWPEETDALPWALFWVGTICQEAGDIVRAIEAFKRLLEEFPQQLEAGAWARWGLANQCYLPRGEFDKGLPLLLEMVAHSNAYEGSNVPHCGALFLPWARLQLAEYLGKAASAYAEQGRPGEFAHLIRGALIGNWSGPSWETLAEAMLALGQGLAVARNAEEEEYYQTVVYDYEHFWLPGVPPPSADRDRGLRWLACFELIYGESRLAKDLCQQVLDGKALTGEGPLAGALLARILQVEHDFRGAYAAYGDALDALSTNMPLVPLLVDLFKGYADRGEHQTAVEEMGNMIAIWAAGDGSAARFSSRIADEVLALAHARMRRADYATARDLFEAALDMLMSEKQTLQTEEQVLHCNMMLGNYETAISLCEEILASRPGTTEDVRARFRIGWCKARQGRYAEAREGFGAIIEENPGTDWATAAQREMERLPQ